MAKVALVAASGFEQAEMALFARGLAQAGHFGMVVSPKKHQVRAWDNTQWGSDLAVDAGALEADAADFQALLIPGGILSADTLRSDAAIVALVREAAALGRPIAAQGHALWLLIEAGLVKGRTITGHPSLRTDAVNAGGQWTDVPVAVDGKVLTGRHTHDAPALLQALLTALG